MHPAPLAALAAALRNNELDLLDYINQACDLVDLYDARIQALLPERERRERLLAEAQQLQRHYPDPAGRPPLYGILTGVKDIFCVDGFETRGGSQLPAELFAGPEAVAVSRLRAAGGLILGKTVTTEFAFFQPGPTRNPHNLNHSPGGSSSGSAAAVAAGYCPLAIGTQTTGSIIRPAAFCGIIGFKPSYDRIPVAGLIACSRSLDHVGLFTQDIAGMQLAAAAVSDAWQPVSSEHRPVLGVPTGPYLEQAAPEALQSFQRNLEQLKAGDYTVVQANAFTDIAQIAARHNRLVEAEMAEVHAEWFARYEQLYAPRTAAAIRSGRTLATEDLEDARAGQQRLRAELQTLMAEQGIDIWLAPAAPGSAPEGIATTGDPAMNLPWTHAGVPVVTVPAGRADNGLPLGLQLAAAMHEDEQLLAWAGEIAAIVK